MAKLIAQYDNYANSIRKIINNRNKHDTQEPHTPTNHETLTGLVHRKIKLILNQDTQRLIASPLVEGYIDKTKEMLLNHVNEIFSQRTTNTPTANELKSLLKLKELDTIIIKPTDKNLGIVIIDTTTYITDCLKHLSSSAYQLTVNFPTSLKDNLQNIFISFKTEIHTFSPALYRYLTTFTNHLPRFYGLPKIHKLSDTITTPPLHPIIRKPLGLPM